MKENIILTTFALCSALAGYFVYLLLQLIDIRISKLNSTALTFESLFSVIIYSLTPLNPAG